MTENTTNKKFWSLIIGCLLSASYLWLVEVGFNASVPSSFQSEMEFIVNYYHLYVTAGASIALTLLVVLFMPRLVNTHVSDHVFWLTVPALLFIIFAALNTHVLFIPALSAAIPSLLIIMSTYLVEKRDQFLPDRMKIW